MPFDAHKNFVTTTVTTAPSPATGGTGIGVATGTGTWFPTLPVNAVVCPADERATLDNAEVVRITARTGTALTVTRAQEGSAARSIVVGDRIFAGATAKTLTDIEAEASTYRLAVGRQQGSLHQQLGAAVAGTYLLAQLPLLPSASIDSGESVFYLDPADYAMSGMITKYLLKAVCLTNATAPALTMTFGLYPVTASAGGADSSTITLGTVAAGSTVAFASPSASSRNQGASGDFTAPAAGYYALAVVTNATLATNARVSLSATVLRRNV